MQQVWHMVLDVHCHLEYAFKSTLELHIVTCLEVSSCFNHLPRTFLKSSCRLTLSVPSMIDSARNSHRRQVSADARKLVLPQEPSFKIDETCVRDGKIDLGDNVWTTGELFCQRDWASRMASPRYCSTCKTVTDCTFKSLCLETVCWYVVSPLYQITVDRKQPVLCHLPNFL